MEYDEDNQPVRVDTVVISTQHGPEVSLAQIREDMIEQVVKPVIPAHLLDENTKYFVNPTGRFVIGGPHGDSGLTGRKIIVDTYGGIGRHGGGAFSGKDPTKVDRSARVCGPLGCEEHRCGRSGKALRDSAGLCHRRGRAGFHHGGDLRHRHCWTTTCLRRP